jgi:hypothetical protein
MDATLSKNVRGSLRLHKERGLEPLTARARDKDRGLHPWDEEVPGCVGPMDSAITITEVPAGQTSELSSKFNDVPSPVIAKVEPTSNKDR